MHHFLEMTHNGQHGQDSFDDHPAIPLAPFTEFEIRGLPTLLLKVNITQHEHVVGYAIDQCLKSRAIIDIGGVASPAHNQSPDD